MYPKTLMAVFGWAEELWLHHGLYTSAIQKAVRYFLTEVDIYGETLSYKTREKYLSTLNDKFNLLDEAAPVGDEYIAFGNSFTSLHLPFTRSLTCRGCGFTAPLSKMRPYYYWEPSLPGFRGKCPQCRWEGIFDMRDLPLAEEIAKPVICHWPPQYMGIKWHPISQRKIFVLNLDLYNYLQTGVRMGDPVFLEDTPWEIVQAICQNKRFEFDDGQICHLSYPVMTSTLPNMKGWGLPPFMSAFEIALLVHMLDKFTEAVVVDYLIPFRMLSPPATGAGDRQVDPLLQINGADFTQMLMNIIAQHRRNPTDWNVFPFPINYQTIGGEAANLVPVQLQEHFEMRLLFSMGIPPEFHNAKAASNAGPIIGFKMFERTWQHFAKASNAWLTWVTQRQGELLKWEKAKARLVPLALAEDPQVRELKFNLAASKQASMSDAFRLVGWDWREQQKKVFEEADWLQEEMTKQQEAFAKQDANRQAIRMPAPGEAMLQQQQMAAGGMAAGGMPGAPAAGGGMPMPLPMAGGGMPMGGQPGQLGATIDQLLAQADQTAQQLMTADPLTRARTLSSLKHSDEALYAQVKSRLGDLESMARQQGVMMARSGQIPAGQ